MFPVKLGFTHALPSGRMLTIFGYIFVGVRHRHEIIYKFIKIRIVTTLILWFFYILFQRNISCLLMLHWNRNLNIDVYIFFYWIFFRSSSLFLAWKGKYNSYNNGSLKVSVDLESVMVHWWQWLQQCCCNHLYPPNGICNYKRVMSWIS